MTIHKLTLAVVAVRLCYHANLFLFSPPPTSFRLFIVCASYHEFIVTLHFIARTPDLHSCSFIPWEKKRNNHIPCKYTQRSAQSLIYPVDGRFHFSLSLSFFYHLASISLLALVAFKFLAVFSLFSFYKSLVCRASLVFISIVAPIVVMDPRRLFSSFLRRA